MTNKEKQDLINDFASTEGWGIFLNTETDKLEIQRIDEDRIFPSDTAALLHVKQLAAKESVAHEVALELTKNT